MRTLDEIKTELDLRYKTASLKRKRARRIASEAVLCAMLCGTFALTAVVTYRYSEQDNIISADTGTSHETSAEKAPALEDRTELDPPVQTSSAEPPATESVTEAVTEAVTENTRVYLPITPESAAPEEEPETTAESSRSEEYYPPEETPAETTVGTETDAPENEIKPITTNKRHNTPKYPGGVDPNCGAYDDRLSLVLMIDGDTVYETELSGKATVAAVEGKLERLLGIAIVSKNHVSNGGGNIYTAEQKYSALITVTDTTDTSREYRLSNLTYSAFLSLQSACR